MSTLTLRRPGPLVSKRIACGILCGCALFAISLPACSDPYGTLFTTAAQRARLDGQSSGIDNIQPISDHSRDKPDSVVPIRLNGTLISSKGKKEVWLDGRPQLSATVSDTGRVRLIQADRVQVQPRHGSVAHAMKPGQVLDPETGAVSEYYAQDKQP